MAGNEKQILELWQSLSHKVLSCVLNDPGAVFPVMKVIDTNTNWFPQKDRPVWGAIMACLDEMVPPTQEAVQSRLEGTSVDYVKGIAGKFNETDNSLLVYNAEQLKDNGILVQARQIFKQFYDETTTVEQVQNSINKATAEFTGLLAKKSNRGAGAIEVSSKAWDLVDNFDGNGIPSGMTWFDEMTGGLWPGMNYWVAAAYKSGKSTLMRNGILNAAEAGYPVGAYCAEGGREMFALACQCMLATRILMDAGKPSENCTVSPIRVLMNWKKGRFSQEEKAAMQQAREIWSTLPIRVYDSADGITDLTTLHYLIKRDKVEYGIQAVWADYSQLFGSGNIYERQSATALKVQDIAAREKIAFCMLAQKNESGVQGNDSYSPNVKGGGDAPAAADFLFIPRIDPDVPNVLEVKLKLSRHTRSGMTKFHAFNPSSGLIYSMFEAKITDFEQD